MGQEELDPQDIDESIKPFYAALKRCWISFCSTTSIHGLKFTNDENTNAFAKAIWWVIVICSFVCSITMVVTFYKDYRSNPTRMNLENDHTPVSGLYFPSVSICPESVFNLQKSEDYIKTLRLPPLVKVSDVLESMQISRNFINREVETFKTTDIALMEQTLKLNNLTIDDFLKNLRWNCKDLIFRCRYKLQIMECEKLFQVSYTFFGYCCSFNLNQTGLNFTGLRAYPGMREGLSLMLYHNDSNMQSYRGYSLGFLLLMEESRIYPSFQSIVKFLPLNEESFVSIRPVETICSTAVRALSFEERQCALAFEYPLKYFNIYAGNHCSLDCRITSTKRICGCVPYFIIHNTTIDRTCSFKDIPCLLDNFPQIVGRFRNTQCFCPNKCEFMEYDVQISGTDLQHDIPTIDPFYKDIKKDYAVVHLYLNSQVYRRVRRDLLSSMVTLVSNLGSAFSLFVGMSMVSVVEIIYHFTVGFHKYYLQELKARRILFFRRNTLGRAVPSNKL